MWRISWAKSPEPTDQDVAALYEKGKEPLSVSVVARSRIQTARTDRVRVLQGCVRRIPAARNGRRSGRRSRTSRSRSTTRTTRPPNSRCRNCPPMNRAKTPRRQLASRPPTAATTPETPAGHARRPHPETRCAGSDAACRQEPPAAPPSRPRTAGTRPRPRTHRPPPRNRPPADQPAPPAERDQARTDPPAREVCRSRRRNPSRRHIRQLPVGRSACTQPQEPAQEPAHRPRPAEPAARRPTGTPRLPGPCSRRRRRRPAGSAPRRRRRRRPPASRCQAPAMPMTARRRNRARRPAPADVPTPDSGQARREAGAVQAARRRIARRKSATRWPVARRVSPLRRNSKRRPTKCAALVERYAQAVVAFQVADRSGQARPARFRGDRQGQ